MSKVTDIEDYLPHWAGSAVCLACAHEWTAITRTTSVGLECPSCHTHRGVLKHAPSLNEYYSCACGCSQFSISPAGIACCLACGERHDL